MQKLTNSSPLSMDQAFQAQRLRAHIEHEDPRAFSYHVRQLTIKYGKEDVKQILKELGPLADEYKPPVQQDIVPEEPLQQITFDDTYDFRRAKALRQILTDDFDVQDLIETLHEEEILSSGELRLLRSLKTVYGL